MLIIIEMISYLCVGGIVVFGVLRATISNRCDDGNKTCQACQLVGVAIQASCSCFKVAACLIREWACWMGDAPGEGQALRGTGTRDTG